MSMIIQLRKHFIKREFNAIESILKKCSGEYCVGDIITYADCFLAPQIRNALASKIDIGKRFPNLNKVWKNMLKYPPILKVFEDAGGIVQPIVVNKEQLHKYIE